MISDLVVKEFDIQAVVAKAVLHDRGHGIEESLDAIPSFEAAARFLEGSGTSVHHSYAVMTTLMQLSFLSRKVS
jgi:hypothetical protein